MVRDLSELSPRQRAILVGLAHGKLGTEIAAELGIKVGTLRQHAKILYDRLGVENHVQAAIVGYRMLEATTNDRGQNADDS